MPNRGLARGPVAAKAVDTARRDANAREARVGSLTAVATRLAEEWSSREGNLLDKIRLTGSPRNSHHDVVPLMWVKAWQALQAPVVQAGGASAPGLAGGFDA